MKTIYFISISLVFSIGCFKNVSAQISQSWVNVFSGYGSFTGLKTMTMNKQSEVYVSGYTHTSSGDLYVTRKYGSDGSVMWHRELSSGIYGLPYDMTTDDSGYIYITGYHDQTNQDKNLYLIKYSPDGDTVWTRKFNLLNSDEIGISINIDRNGNLLVTGRTNNDMLTLKYTSGGDYLWHMIYTQAGSFLNPKNIVTDRRCNIYCAGSTSGPEQNLFLVKYDSSGNLLWVNQAKGDIQGYDQRKMSAIDSRGNIYIVGQSRDSLTMNMMLVCKYDPDGNLIGRFTTFTGQCNSIAIDDADNSYLTGAVNNLSSSNDIATFKLDSALSLIWFNSYNQSGYSVEEGKSVAVSNSGNVYVLGSGYGIGFNAMVTLKYSGNGIFKWVSRYLDGDNGVRIIPNDSNEVFTSGNKNNFITIKYGDDLTYAGSNNILLFGYELFQNFPNPFNPSTTIKYNVINSARIKIVVFDVSGREVKILKDGVSGVGSHQISFDGNDMSSGIYFYSLYVEGKTMDTKRMVLIK